MVGEGGRLTKSENLSSLLICALVKSGKSLDDFYVVHPTSCSRQRKHFPLSQQIFKVWISLLTRRIFLSFSDFSRRRQQERCTSECLWEWKVWTFVLTLDFHEKCLKNGTWAWFELNLHWTRTQTNKIYHPIKIVSHIQTFKPKLAVISFFVRKYFTSECLGQFSVFCLMLSRCVRMKVHFLISVLCILWVRVPSVDVCVCVCFLSCKLVRGSREKHFQFIKTKNLVERRKKLIWRIMLRVNIFFMLFEKLFVRDKRVIVVGAIDFLSSSVLANRRFFFFFTLFSILALQKLIYSMDQLTKCHWNMLRHGNRTLCSKWRWFAFIHVTIKAFEMNLADVGSCKKSFFKTKINHHLSTWQRNKAKANKSDKFLIIDFSFLASFCALKTLFFYFAF